VPAKKDAVDRDYIDACNVSRHFKACGACHTPAYCCKEHQTEDWPAHKAACKAAQAACKAAAELAG
jgi:hypothetical protein